MYKHYLNINKQPIQLSITFLIAFVGGMIFVFLHLPIPWLLGPMIAVLVGSKLGKLKLYWPIYLRETGLVIAGYSIGLSFTKSALIQIFYQLPLMLIMTFLLLGFCVLIATIVSKLSGINYPTILTGSIPGGLTQIITLAEEMKGIDLTTVAFFQVVRLMMIIIFIPFIIFSPYFGVESNNSLEIIHKISGHWDTLFPNIILFIMVSVLFAFIGKKINLPTPFMLGPIIATALINITGFHGPALPSSLLSLSQFMLGGYIGLLLKPEEVNHKSKIIPLALVSSVVLIIGSFCMSLLLMKLLPISLATSILSLAPGGMDQMGIIAQEVHADLSIVTAYQLSRILFIYFAVPPILKVYFRHLKRQKEHVA
ncbi:AbrB family transcriptional regulator [Bacillus sp. RG28]|uniref:AbrB family transcriptional regulator n=1 Tax=Gottfriedia endophytica TaxID=2820819 RepID=A0A940NN77_9BACI|nr:AbrB family transcriptional regulator [Gottfriedia endophytica]MBP0725249.1 AbrB family transcriptional regulator [Gottfriedia endophytica]